MPLEGKKVILREERPEDMPRLLALQNNMETQAWGQSLPPDYTENMYLKRFQGREFSYAPKEGRFIIVSKETGEFAGMISYANLHPRWSAMLGIMMDKKSGALVLRLMPRRCCSASSFWSWACA